MSVICLTVIIFSACIYLIIEKYLLEKEAPYVNKSSWLNLSYKNQKEDNLALESESPTHTDP